MSNAKQLFTRDSLRQAHEAFSKNGIVFFDQILPYSVLQEAEHQIEQKVANESNTENLVNLHLEDKEFANLVSQKSLINIASKLLGVDSVRVFSSMILNKPPNARMTVPWHQDAAYDWPLKPADCASLWLAIDDVTPDKGAMKVALGGHKVGAIPMGPTENLQEDDEFFSSQLTNSIPQSALEDFTIIDVTMNKGQASFHHSMLPHSSTPNFTNNRRCAFIVRYCRGDAQIIRYPGMPREAYFKNFELFNPYY